MLVAGSVLALLLAGLTVDGLLHPTVDEEGADTDGNSPDNDDQPGSITTLEDLLFPDGDAEDEDKTLQGRAEALGYTPLDDDEYLPEAPETENTTSAAEFDNAANFKDEALAGPNTGGDSDGFSLESDLGLGSDGTGDAGLGASGFGSDFDAGLETGGDAQNLQDVTETITLSDGSEVPFVTDFESETDILIMEFDGAEDDAPEITVTSDAESADAIVQSNGQTVTVVQDVPDFTEKNISLVMSGIDDGLPGTEFDEFETYVDSLDSEQPDGFGEVGSGADGADPASEIMETAADGMPDTDVLADVFGTLGENLSDLGSSSDMLDARADLDPAFGTGGADAMTGSFNSDVLTGDDGQDALFGDDGNDTLSGGAGNDEIHGDFGDDNLDGGDGIDFVDGGEGNDTLNGGNDNDILFGNEGDDLVEGGEGHDILLGGAGADVLDGGPGNDVLNGTFGDHFGNDQDAGDTLLGGGGDDSILLGNGDVATGGTGEDLFTGGDHIDDAAGHITDFNPGEDRIEVIYDPASTPNPMIEVRDFENGTGADIILDGQVILSVSGAQGLDPNLIELRANA